MDRVSTKGAEETALNQELSWDKYIFKFEIEDEIPFIVSKEFLTDQPTSFFQSLILFHL